MNEQLVEDKQNDKERKISAKKILFALLLILPTLLAVVSFYMVYNNVYFSSSNIYDITLLGPDDVIIGHERNYLRNAEKDGLVSLFSPITENFKDNVKIPEDFDRTNHFKAVVKYMNVETEYNFYFSVENTVGYCTVGLNSYKLSGSDTEKFLSSNFAEKLYASSVPPVMYSISGNVITPETVSWNYRTVGGYYNSTKNYISTDDVNTYDMSGALGITFDKMPSKCTVKVFKGDDIVYSGNSNGISSLAFDTNEALRLEVKADWEYSNGVKYYGSTTYVFDATVSERAEFHITGDTFAVDSFCGIFCTNVKNPSKIEFISEPPFPNAPEFVLSRENAVALLPITPETAIGKYKIILKYGATTQTFSIEIKMRVGSEMLECSADEDTLKNALSESTQNEILSLKSFVAEKSKGEKLFYGEFLDYRDEDIGATQYSHFGDAYVNYPQDMVYFSDGHEYRFDISGGVSIPALNSGLVIKKGYNDSLGNYVIVSHGCGLATWYSHLSTVDVAVGEYVVKGQMVGKTGVTGLSSIENVMIYVTIGDAFMNPQYLCGKQFD